MRLDFNVLWVEDQPNRIGAQAKAISDQMQSQGFYFNRHICQTIDEVRSRIENDVFTDEIDLILVDWDLGEQTKGQDVIAEIREHIQYKDIIFYSAMSAARDLRQIAFSKGLEGIYCVTRTDLVEEVIGVFDSLVKKVLDLDHVRGIVMGSTSDIDYMVHECLRHIHEQRDAKAREAMLKEAHQRINDRLKDITQQAEELLMATTLSEVLKAHMLFTANDRLRMLSRALEDEAFITHNSYRSHVTLYLNQVIPERNKLGHQVLTPNGRPRAFTGHTGQEISLEDTRALRCRILELRSHFRELLAALQRSA